jgi:PKD repeat protein
MKKSIFTIFFSSLLIYSFAQISITNADMPVSGDTLRNSKADPADTALLNHNYTVAGANMFWDFSGLKSIEQDVDTFKPTNQTPYKLAFFGRYGLKQDNILIMTDVYDYYENTTTSFNVVGKGLTANITTSLQLTGNYTVKDKVYQFPLIYGDRDSSTFSNSSTALGLATYSSDGYRINEVDGWGSIKTPFGTFNCLRVKTTYISNDTFSQSIVPFPIGTTTQRIEYKWLAKGQHIPILEVTGTTNGTGNFTISKVRFRDKKRNVVSPNAPKANFTADKTNPTNIETVTFTNQTTAPLFPQPVFEWTFTPAEYQFVSGTTAVSRNPKVLFTKPGYYTVKLKATNSSGTDDSIKVNYINVSRNTLNLPFAGFTADKTSPLVTDTVNFTNTSTVAVTSKYLWTVTPSTCSFINSDDTFPDPSIKFYGAGKYTVALFVNNFYGSDTLIKKDYIVAAYPGSVNDDNALARFNIYPNPVVSDDLNFIFDMKSRTSLVVELFDLKGSRIAELLNFNYKPGQYNLSFNLSGYNLLNSVYFIKIVDGQNTRFLKVLYCR